MKRLVFTFICFFAPLCSEEIFFWHAFEGFLEEKFSELVTEFNQSSQAHQVSLVRKGNYKETYEEGLSALAEGNPPHILQVYEVATLSMMLSSDTFVPVEHILKDFDPSVYIDIIRQFYSDPSGEMLSLPWNASTGILFYNKEAFRQAGLDPECPPKTWPEFEQMGRRLVDAGYMGYTTAWPAAYHLEYICFWHGLPFATERNGLDSLSSRLAFDGEGQTFHFQKLVQWQNEGLFSYSGRYTAEPEAKFAEGTCAILLQGANRLPLLERMCDFEIGVGFMPYWPQLVDEPQALSVGGASFWVLKGFSREEYEAIGEFLTYLSSPEVQAKWHQETGYLPITKEAYRLTKEQNYYQDHPASEIAVLEVMREGSDAYFYGVRLQDYVTIRDQIVDYLEKVLNGEMSPEEALKALTER